MTYLRRKETRNRMMIYAKIQMEEMEELFWIHRKCALFSSFPHKPYFYGQFIERKASDTLTYHLILFHKYISSLLDEHILEVVCGNTKSFSLIALPIKINVNTFIRRLPCTI